MYCSSRRGLRVFIMPLPLIGSQPSSDGPLSTASHSAIAKSETSPTPEPDFQFPKMVEKWQGWAELENDPAIFSTLLREWGVPSVQVQEVFDLDGLFDQAADSIFGLVFLSRWAAAEKATDHQLTAAPADLWFANQVCSAQRHIAWLTLHLGLLIFLRYRGDHEHCQQPSRYQSRTGAE